jgi:hypothetical protein
VNEAGHSVFTWGSAVRVIVVEVVTLLALFALQQAFTS